MFYEIYTNVIVQVAQKWSAGLDGRDIYNQNENYFTVLRIYQTVRYPVGLRLGQALANWL